MRLYVWMLLILYIVHCLVVCSVLIVEIAKLQETGIHILEREQTLLLPHTG